MTSIFLLVPLSLALVGIAVWAFFWAVDHDQFERLDEPARAALEEDPPIAGPQAADRLNGDANSPRA